MKIGGNSSTAMTGRFYEVWQRLDKSTSRIHPALSYLEVDRTGIT